MVMPYSEMTPRIEWTIVVLLAVLGVVLGTAVGVPENESIMAGMEEEVDDPPDHTTMMCTRDDGNNPQQWWLCNPMERPGCWKKHCQDTHTDIELNLQLHDMVKHNNDFDKNT